MTNSVVYIVSGARTPVGNFNGNLSGVSASCLGFCAMKAAIKRANLSGNDVSEVVFGHVLTAGTGQNAVRQAAMAAEIPQEVPSYSVNMLCGSGLRSVGLAYQAIRCGDSDIVVAGGQESMSQAPHCINMRSGIKMGNATLQDTMIVDGLTDAFQGIHMGITAENIASRWSLTRQMQDEFALNSQRKASIAQHEGRFVAEIAPVTISSRHGDVVVDTDEFIKHDCSIASLAKLRPAFIRDASGTVTAGNASGINDGAAAVVLMSAVELERRCIAVGDTLGKIVSFAQSGVDPAIMGIGPVSATEKALAKAGWAVNDVDLFELNEAFAAQSLAVLQELGVKPDNVNVNGGAIALGHPIGASGARILVTLLYEMKRRGVSKGVASLCVGGGMGVAMCIER